MGRIAPLAAGVVAAGVVASGGAAQAGPTRKIRVETTPEKAHVYLDDIESGAKCDATPCEFDAPIGDSVLIVRLDKYEPLAQPIDVKKAAGRKPQLFTFELKAAVAMVVCDDAKAKGASIQIDGKEKGKCPGKVDVEPGGHQVIVKLGSKTLFEDFVDVDAGAEKQLELEGVKDGGKGNKEHDKDKDGGDDNSGDDDHKAGSGSADSGGAITKPASSDERSRFISAQLVVDVGWRHFAYDNIVPGSMLPTTEDESGQFIGGPAIELWPMELAHASVLRGLSLYLRAEFKLNQLDVKDSTGASLAKTYWGSYEASLRYRWQFDAAAVEASAGYVRDQVQYDTDGTSLMLLPAADYQSIRIGGRGFYRSGAFEPYISAETRVVMSGGDLQNRYTNASATGLRGALGVTATAGAISARLEASYLQYSWTYPTNVSSPPPASGASDQIFGVSLSAGYQY